MVSVAVGASPSVVGVVSLSSKPLSVFSVSAFSSIFKLSNFCIISVISGWSSSPNSCAVFSPSITSFILFACSSNLSISDCFSFSVKSLLLMSSFAASSSAPTCSFLRSDITWSAMDLSAVDRFSYAFADLSVDDFPICVPSPNARPIMYVDRKKFRASLGSPNLSDTFAINSLPFSDCLHVFPSSSPSSSNISPMAVSFMAAPLPYADFAIAMIFDVTSGACFPNSAVMPFAN